MTYRRTANRAFTLIEVLIVVAIIAVMASVVLVGVSGSQKAGRDTRRKADLGQIQVALGLYFLKHGTYQVAGTGGGGGGSGWLAYQTGSYYVVSVEQGLISDGDMSSVICDPNGWYCGNIAGTPPNKAGYMLYPCNPLGWQSYVLYAHLESPSPADTTNYNNIAATCGDHNVNCGGAGCGMNYAISP